MKGEVLPVPFDGYLGYRQLHPNGRVYMYMYNPTTKKRTLTSLARFNMAVKLGRVLDKSETVDHKDEDSTNDDVDNLQILGHTANIRKHHLNKRGMIWMDVKQLCVVCGETIYDARPRVTCSIDCQIVTRTREFKNRMPL